MVAYRSIFNPLKAPFWSLMRIGVKPPAFHSPLSSFMCLKNMIATATGYKTKQKGFSAQNASSIFKETQIIQSWFEIKFENSCPEDNYYGIAE